jgi:hypothetical protein
LAKASSSSGRVFHLEVDLVARLFPYQSDAELLEEILAPEFHRVVGLAGLLVQAAGVEVRRVIYCYIIG